MAGYKTTVINANPVSFHTFDYDSQILHSGMIFDEMNSNKNPMYTNGLNYELEYVSMNQMETSDQASILFARNQKYGGQWSPVWMNIPHSSDYNLSEWSLEFFLNKSRPDDIRNSGEPGWGNTKITPIVKKGTAIRVETRDYWYSGGDGIYVTLFAGTDDEITISHAHSTDYPVFNPTQNYLDEYTNHYVVTYGVQRIDVNEYGSSLRLYQNGKLMAKHDFNSFDAPPNMVDASQWLVCGDGGGNPTWDFPTEYTAFDQFAIYNYPLSEEQISNHYRKTKTYEKLIKFDKPTNYWRMNDVTTLNNNMVAVVGTTGQYYGSIIKDQPSTPYVVDSKSVKFSNGGTAKAIKTNNAGYLQFLNINADYTIECWFNISQNDEAILFSCHEEIPNYRGVTIFSNRKDNHEQKGVIQCRESTTYILQTKDGMNYTDGKWHHLIFRRSGTKLAIIIDGTYEDEIDEAPILGVNGKPSQVHLMAIDPGLLYCDGYLSEVAMYNKALSDMQINSHYHFSTRHKIFGYTLLEGQGVNADVRFYDDITGDLVGTTKSSTVGEYTFYTYSNKKLDIVALLPDNRTTRYRIHAPIVPSEFDDPHI